MNEYDSRSIRVGSDTMTLSDIERRDLKVKFFRWISFITLAPFDPEWQNSAG